jgi:hypothetical protein
MRLEQFKRFVEHFCNFLSCHCRTSPLTHAA